MKPCPCCKLPILEGNPYAVVEGMMIAGYAIGASEGYFYMRAEYPIAVNRLRNAIRQMNGIGILGENIPAAASASRRTSAWAQVHSSAAKKPHCSIPSKASAACPVPARRSRQ